MAQPSSDPKPDDVLLADLDAALADKATDPLSALAGLLRQGSGRRRVLEATALQGTKVAEHTLTHLIGVGGMGATYRSTDSGGDEVAIKIVGALSDEQRDRFESECQILRKLDHPGIVRYRSHGISADGNGYLVMDFVEAVNLQEVLEDIDGAGMNCAITADLLEGMDVFGKEAYASASLHRRMIRIIASVADALSHAHKAGIIHRDIKPANILIRRDLRPVLIDFGLGRDLFRNVTLTRTGAVMGTLSYMAPEQLHSDDSKVDARADIFSLGLVLYRCLVGEDLRHDASGVFRSSRAPLLFSGPAMEHVPRELQAILYACVDPRPNKRYQEISQMSEDLEGALGSGPVRARFPGPLSRCARTPGGRALLVSPFLIAATVAIYLLLAPGRFLWVDALYDGGNLYLDDDRTPWKTPLSRVPVTPGLHVLRLEDDDSKIRREFVIDRRFSRITILNPRLERMDIQHDWCKAENAAYLRVHGGAANNSLWIDDRPIPPIARWVKLKPGLHTVRARSPAGFEESQRLELRPSEVHLAHLLLREMKDVRGSFRYSMASIMAPRPEHVELELEDGAVRYINAFPEIEGERDQIAMQSMVTSLHPGKEVSATLRVRFPARMRSLVFMQLSRAHEPATLSVEYRTEHRAWQPVPKVYTPHQDLVPVQVDPGGTRWFELRGRIKVEQDPESWSTSKFLANYMDRYREKDTCCFAIVADPDPDTARIR